MKRTKLRLGILGFFIALILVAGIRLVIKGLNEIDLAEKNDLPDTYSITHEDSSLISKDFIRRIKCNRIINSKAKNAVSFLDVDDRYRLIIYKINIIKEAPLQEILQTNIRGSERTNGEVYSSTNISSYYKYIWRSDPTEKISKIHFSMLGDSVKNVISNDSIVSYHVSCRNLSIKYEENGPVDVFATGYISALANHVIPSNILFLKKGNAVYFFLLTPISGNGSMPANLLCDIIGCKKSV